MKANVRKAMSFTPKREYCLKGAIALLLVIAVWLPGPLALADAMPSAIPGPPTVPATELNATDIPSEKVDQFVSAYLSVAHLIDDRNEELQRAETETESLQLQRAIESEAFSLIEATGLNRQDYFQLLGLANTDPEFRDRVLAQLEETEN